MTINDGNAQYLMLRRILGDQLNPGHRWFDEIDSGVLYVIAELHQEATLSRAEWCLQHLDEL